MSQRAKVIIKGVEVDHESLAALPLSFSKSTDEPSKVVGTGGLFVDNSVKRLYVPATKPGNEAFDHAHVPSSDTQEAQESKPVQIIINGDEVFGGQVALRECEIIDGIPQGYGLEVYGGNQEFFSALQNVSLRSLDIGSIEYDAATIEASWLGSYDSGLSYLFAPVVYKGDNSTAAHDFQYSDFRPHLYFPSIIDAIGNYLGYTIESQFFQTEFFKKHVYLFGVGRRWAKFSDSLIYTESRPGPETPPAGNFNYVPVGQDPTTGFGSWTISITKDDAYDIFLDVGLRWACDVRIVDQNGNLIGEFPQGSQDANPLVLSEIPLLDGDVLTVEFRRLSSGQSFLDGPLSWEVSAVTYPVLGGDIRASSCLHDNPVLDFIRGISHQFNLAWGVNTLTQTLYAEPRFDYEIGGTQYPGFYHHGLGATTVPAVDITQSVSTERITEKFLRPFGDALVLSCQEEESVLFERTKEANTGTIPFLSSRLPMIENGEEEETVENPYWEHLLTIEGGRINVLDLPIVCPKYDSETGFPEDEKDLFLSGPKFAYYLGVVPNRTIYINGTPTAQGVPMVCQKPGRYTPPANLPPVLPCYPDGGYDLNTVSVPGYVSTFYPQFHAIFRKGLQTELQQNLTAPQFLNEDFRGLKSLRLGGSFDTYILLSIKDFRPLESVLTNVVLLKMEPLRQDVFALIEHNTQESGVRL